MPNKQIKIWTLEFMLKNVLKNHLMQEGQAKNARNYSIVFYFKKKDLEYIIL